MKAPFPWFGGKSRVAHIVWQRFGNVPNYVEPFYGSGAVHLLRPEAHKGTLWPLETINDYDGFVANFWRAIQHDPEQTAQYADWPVNENDLHARHYWLVQQRETLRGRLEGDPEWFDAKVAGWWCWGLSVWIGSRFTSGDGPWHVVDGMLVNTNENDGDGRGVHRQRVHLGDAGRGVHRQRVHLGDAGMGVQRQLVHLGNAGMGVQRQRVHLGTGMGAIYEWFAALSERLARVRVCSGDWSRVCGPTPTVKQGLTGVFLDPPYGEEADRDDLYTEDSHTIAHDVRAWCIANGDNPLLRIALCGYDGEHNEMEALGWSAHSWRASGGYAKQRVNGTNENRHRERIWFSPGCLGDMAGLPLLENMA